MKASILTIWILLTITVRLEAQAPEYDAFVPLKEGNYWEYVLSHHTFDAGDMLVPGYHSTEILGDSILNETRYRLVAHKAYDAYLKLTCTRISGVVVDSLGRIDSNFPVLRIIDETTGIGCGKLSGPSPFSLGPFNYILADTVIHVSGIEYPITAMAGYHYHASGPSGSGGGTDRFYAAGIGLFYHHYVVRYSWHEEGGSDEFTYELNYAIVNGSTYGIKAVSIEEVSSQNPEKSGEIAFYPNPFRDAFYISLNDGSTEVDYEIYDVLGRLISSGRSGKRIELPVGPAGIYLIQLKKSGSIMYRGQIARTNH